MARGPKVRVPRLQGIALWAPITALLTLGLLTTVIDLMHLPVAEERRANATEQRFTVNAGTGEVSLGLGEKKPEIPVAAPSALSTDEDAAATTPPADAAAPSADANAGGATDGATPAANSDAKAPAPSSDAAAPTMAGVTPETAAGAPPAAIEAPPATEHATTSPTPAATANPAATPANAAPASSDAAAKLPDGTPALRTAPLVPKLDAPVYGKESLVNAPAPEVTEIVDGVKIPKRGEKDQTPAKLYAHPFKRTADQIPVSFVVVNAGLDPQSVGLILGLPAEVSVAYSAYTHPESGYSDNVRAAGHEVWTVLPVMSDHYPSDDPGPMGLIGRMPPEEVTRRLYQVFAAVPGSVGMVLPADEAITAQQETLAPVVEELNKRGLLLLSTHPTHSIEQITHNKDLEGIIRRADLVLDPAPNEAQIKSKLSGVLESAKEKGEYIVVLSARPQSLQILGDWLRANPLAAPYALAPLSAIYQSKDAAVEAPPADEKKPEEKKKKPAPGKPKKVLPQDQYEHPAVGKDGKPEEKKPDDKKDAGAK